MRRSILLSLAAVLVTACGTADEPGPTIDPLPDESTDDTQTGASDALLGPEVQQAVADAAARAGVADDEVLVTVTEQVTWPDGAIGCPEPEMMYTQALVDGYRIVVEAGGDSYVYHGQDGAEPFHCEQPQDPASVR